MNAISRQAVAAKMVQWERGAEIHFCQLAKAGATFQNITYPTGLRMVIASAVDGSSKAEVALSRAKALRDAGYWIRA